MITSWDNFSRRSAVSFRFYAVVLVLGLWGCLPTQHVIVPVADESASTIVLEDTMEAVPVRSWIIPDYPERFLRPLRWDLLHQKMWIRFDFNQSAVLGTTELMLSRIASGNTELILDAKTMDIHQVVNVRTGQELLFDKQELTLHIAVDSVGTAFSDTLIVRVVYTAHPPNRGLYFVNPRGEEQKPTQVWTLGQPEDNSYWLPTIDHPAERTTSELWLSVPDHFTTISNGKMLQGAFLAGDSLRTDYWVMDKPHAPYLFALAAGIFETSEEVVNGVILRYATEPDFAPYHADIFRNTSDMLRFFEQKLGVAYPWQVYTQVPVRDFIAGGMENTTATFLYEHVQVTGRQAKDVEHQDLIAHELIHQWFGNLVTCEDWANLPMNEGFANYFEALYRYHRDGQAAGDWTILNFQQAYLSEASRFRRPLISNRYNEPEDLYDRHTYEKAGLVLRMLHHYIEDENWWASLQLYLTRHAYDSINFTDLQRAVEQQYGASLTWFFDPWFTQPGHAEIAVSTEYQTDNVYVHLTQTQDVSLQPLYTLPVDIHFTTETGEFVVQRVHWNTADTTIVIPNINGKIGEVVVDPNRILLATYTEDIDATHYISRLAHPSVFLRMEAIDYLGARLAEHPDFAERLMEAYHTEPVSGLRRHILMHLMPLAQTDWLPFIESISIGTEPYFANRILSATMSFNLRGTDGNEYLEMLRDDPSYYVERHLISLFSKGQ